MSIIDDTYFIGDISLPTDNANYINKLQVYIDSTEREYLIGALGYELYKLFQADLPTPTEPRFTDILNGAEFTNKRGNLDKWQGLVNTEKQSMLAYFTYPEYLGSVGIDETGNGTTMTVHENSENINPIGKQVTAFNLGVKQYRKLYSFLLANEGTYPEWEYTPVTKTNIFNI